MARHTIAEPRIQKLVERLINLVQFEGSVRAAHKAIEAALAGGGGGTVYPNRLHALLSEDPSRGVNTATVELLELAFSRLPEVISGGEFDAVRTTVLRACDLAEALDTVDSNAAVRRLAEETSLPPAIVKAVLRLEGRLNGPSARRMVGTAPTRPARRPDWSFQDVAVERVTTALKAGANIKVAAVIPTGGGKTRVAMRVALRELRESSRADYVVLWVTHRRRLQVQAHRELQRALGSDDLGEQAVVLFDGRVKIIMISDLEEALRANEGRIHLVIVDEAHHAAAPSYRPLFDGEPLRGLFLTATPNRADGLPIGIDRIAYHITYRELFERRVIVEPTFEDPMIDGLDFSRGRGISDLADYLLQRTEEDLRKIIVAVTRKEHTEQLYDAMQEALVERGAHPLAPDDVVFVHGSETSTGTIPDDLLDEFVARPRGILIATSQLIGEGFDDPAVDGVVVTYPSESVGHLMQVAGRALRSVEGKQTAHIIQVRHSPLAYHFEQRWLYQDISDRLRPQLLDFVYGSAENLREQIASILQEHHVSEPIQDRVITELRDVIAGERYHLLLSGLPYFNKQEAFRDASWGAVLASPDERARFIRIFNDFSDRGGDVSSYHDFLRSYIAPDKAHGSLWKSYLDMLAAMASARKELEGMPYEGGTCRPYFPNRGTTWLTYLTFEYCPALPPLLNEFLEDAVNRNEVSASYLGEPAAWTLALKVPLPLVGTWAFLLDSEQTMWLETQRGELKLRLREVAPLSSFGEVSRWRAGLGTSPLPQLVLDHVGLFISDARFGLHSLRLDN